MAESTGRVVIVTGASSGIGEATARMLAAHGDSVVAVARRGDRLRELAEAIRAAGGDARALSGDVTDRGSVDSIVNETIDHYGRIDVLVNNAGVMPLAGVAKAKLDDWEAMVDVNVKGVLFCTHAVLPHMLRSGSGHVVNVSSIAGRRVFPQGAVYCGTKFFVHAFSEGLRSELAEQNIRVTIIAPGLVKTELQGHVADPEIKARLDALELEWLTSEDVARGIVYALEQPAHVSVNEIVIRPTEQSN